MSFSVRSRMSGIPKRRMARRSMPRPHAMTGCVQPSGSVTSGRKIEEENYWGDEYPALEWSLPNPPPAHTFEILPTREEWDKQQPAHH